jgi:hypothetical protein
MFIGIQWQIPTQNFSKVKSNYSEWKTQEYYKYYGSYSLVILIGVRNL